MPRIELMSWQSRQRRWIKKHRSKQYAVSCRQLGTEPTREASRALANRTLALMHPRLVAVGGGEGEFRRVMESNRQQLAGATLIEVRFPSPPKFVTCARHDFVSVPVLQVLNMKGKRIETHGAYLGARGAAEVKWRYIDATLLDRQQVKALFPDLPDDVDLTADLPR